MFKRRNTNLSLMKREKKDLAKLAKMHPKKIRKLTEGLGVAQGRRIDAKIRKSERASVGFSSFVGLIRGYVPSIISIPIMEHLKVSSRVMAAVIVGFPVLFGASTAAFVGVRNKVKTNRKRRLTRLRPYLPIEAVEKSHLIDAKPITLEQAQSVRENVKLDLERSKNNINLSGR